MSKTITSQFPFPEEWLSAYLDNELTAEQLSQVEQAIKTIPQLSAQIDDLRATRNAVSQLPGFHEVAMVHPVPTSWSTNSNSSFADLDDGLEVLAITSPALKSPITGSDISRERALLPTPKEKRPSFNSRQDLQERRSPWRFVGLAASIFVFATIGWTLWQGWDASPGPLVSSSSTEREAHDSPEESALAPSTAPSSLSESEPASLPSFAPGSAPGAAAGSLPRSADLQADLTDGYIAIPPSDLSVPLPSESRTLDAMAAGSDLQFSVPPQDAQAISPASEPKVQSLADLGPASARSVPQPPGSRQLLKQAPPTDAVAEVLGQAENENSVLWFGSQAWSEIEIAQQLENNLLLRPLRSRIDQLPVQSEQPAAAQTQLASTAVVRLDQQQTVALLERAAMLNIVSASTPTNMQARQMLLFLSIEQLEALLQSNEVDYASSLFWIKPKENTPLDPRVILLVNPN